MRAPPATLPAHRWAWVIAPLAALLLYLRGIAYPFVDWDDNQYVFANALLTGAQGPAWKALLTTYVMGNYHPITMLSYAVEVWLAGMDPLVMHTTQVVLHAVNTGLLSLVLLRLTGHRTAAIAGAILFAVNPMHVENVAWISARKDLLMLLFGLLGTLAWLRFREVGSPRWAVAAWLLLALACLSKAMAVAFVPTWMLMDHWRGHPLWRLRGKAVWLPFIALAVAIGLVALDAQASVEALERKNIPWDQRSVLGLGNLGFYLLHQLVPWHLSVFHAYPAPGPLPAAHSVLAIAAAGLVVLFLLHRGLRRDVAALGFWIMIAQLVLILQWIPVGEALRADRYAYAAGIGFALVAVRALQAAGQALRLSPQAWPYAALLLATLHAAIAWQRLPVWSDPLHVWTEMLEHEPQRYWHYLDRASTHERMGRHDEALADLDRAVYRSGEDVRPRYERGSFRIRRRSYREAMPDLLHVFQRMPAYPGLLPQMIYVEMKLGMCADVIGNSTAALSLEPDNVEFLNMRAYCRLQQGETQQALEDLQRSLALRADYAEVWTLHARARLALGDTSGACADLRASLSLPTTEPDLTALRDSLVGHVCP